MRGFRTRWLITFAGFPSATSPVPAGLEPVHATT